MMENKPTYAATRRMLRQLLTRECHDEDYEESTSSYDADDGGYLNETVPKVEFLISTSILNSAGHSTQVQKEIPTDQEDVETQSDCSHLFEFSSAIEIGGARRPSRSLSGSLSKFSIHLFEDSFESSNGKTSSSFSGSLSKFSVESENGKVRCPPRSFSGSLSRFSVQTISQLLEDSFENILVFGEAVDRNSVCSAPKAVDCPTPVPRSGHGSGDDFDKIMMSLAHSGSFHNSFNDWMGSMSDIKETKKTIGVRLTSKDIRLSKGKIKDMNESTPYHLKSSKKDRKKSSTLRKPQDTVEAFSAKNLEKAAGSQSIHDNLQTARAERLHLATNVSTDSTAAKVSKQNAPRPQRQPSPARERS